MKTRELIEVLQVIDPDGELQVRVDAAAAPGMVCMTGVTIAGVTRGFDWDIGSVVLHPVARLTRENKLRREKEQPVP